MWHYISMSPSLFLALIAFNMSNRAFHLANEDNKKRINNYDCKFTQLIHNLFLDKDSKLSTGGHTLSFVQQLYLFCK